MTVVARDRLEARFHAMGTDVLVVAIDAPRGLTDHAPALLERLEARWSRFRPDSELCRLNDAGGACVVVSEDTFALIERAVLGWQVTDGRYDPTVLAAVEAAGYDRDFDSVDRDGPAVDPGRPTPGCAQIDLDEAVRSVRLPRGVALDLGGIGKGYAADLVAHALLDAGAAGVLVSLGGDARALGVAPRPGGWSIEIEDPFGDDSVGRSGLGRLCVSEGAVATSSRMRRSWCRGGASMHHLIDPATGAPTTSGLASVTVVAGEGWCAEVLAKAAFVAGNDGAERVLADAGVTGVLVTDDGNVRAYAGMESFR